MSHLNYKQNKGQISYLLRKLVNFIILYYFQLKENIFPKLLDIRHNKVFGIIK